MGLKYTKKHKQTYKHNKKGGVRRSGLHINVSNSSRSASASKENSGDVYNRSRSRSRSVTRKHIRKSRGRSKRRSASKFFEELYGVKFSPRRINKNRSPSPELPLEWEDKFRRDASIQRRNRKPGYVTPPEYKVSPPQISSKEKERNIKAFLANFDSD